MPTNPKSLVRPRQLRTDLQRRIFDLTLELNDVRAQRDALLAACKVLCNYVDDRQCPDQYHQARAAIVATEASTTNATDTTCGIEQRRDTGALPLVDLEKGT